MIQVFDSLRMMTFTSIALRMLLAVVCGGAVGIEREYKRRPAGFRTHILICMGACMTTLTSQYLYLCMGYFTDMARLGAQVIAGIGFIGAGTIIVTRQQRVKGLTTAAGLWSTAIIGLALGAGFFEISIFATFLILMAEIVFSKIAYGIMDSAPEINLYLEYTDATCLDSVLQLFREKNVKVQNMEITRTLMEHNNACAIFDLRLHKKYKVNDLVQDINSFPNVAQVNEL